MKKIVISKDYGGFELPPQFKYLEDDLSSHEIRENQELIDYIESCGGQIVFEQQQAEWSCKYNIVLGITIIPDEATDYIVTDYDGLEEVLFVIDGKIKPASIYKAIVECED